MFSLKGCISSVLQSGADRPNTFWFWMCKWICAVFYSLTSGIFTYTAEVISFLAREKRRQGCALVPSSTLPPFTIYKCTIFQDHDKSMHMQQKEGGGVRGKRLRHIRIPTEKERTLSSRQVGGGVFIQQRFTMYRGRSF